jgi:hypothetical protein
LSQPWTRHYSWSLPQPNSWGTQHPDDLAQQLLLTLQSPLHCLGHRLREASLGDGLLQSSQGVLRLRLLVLEPLMLPGRRRRICSGLGHTAEKPVLSITSEKRHIDLSVP